MNNKFGGLYKQTKDLATGYNNYSHHIKSIEIIGDEVFADIDLMDTFNGKILQEIDSELIEASFKPIFYGEYDTDENGNKTYKHVNLLSIDLVY